MRTDIRPVTISAPPEEVLAFVGDPAKCHDGRWVVITASGEVGVTIHVDRRGGHRGLPHGARSRS